MALTADGGGRKAPPRRGGGAPSRSGGASARAGGAPGGSGGAPGVDASNGSGRTGNLPIRWPAGTEIAPSGKGPGGGRFKAGGQSAQQQTTQRSAQQVQPGQPGAQGAQQPATKREIADWAKQLLDEMVSSGQLSNKGGGGGAEEEKPVKPSAFKPSLADAYWDSEGNQVRAYRQTGQAETYYTRDPYGEQTETTAEPGQWVVRTGSAVQVMSDKEFQAKYSPDKPEQPEDEPDPDTAPVQGRAPAYAPGAGSQYRVDNTAGWAVEALRRMRL